MFDSIPVTVLVDTHVHAYPCFDLGELFNAACRNFSRVPLLAGDTAPFVGVLVLTENAGLHVFRDLRAAAEAEGADAGMLADSSWQVTTEPGGVWVIDAEGRRLLLLPGRQIVSAEGLEVLALFVDHNIKDGATAEALVEHIGRSGGIAVLPWGVGKWFGRRGRILRRIVLERGSEVALGDNGGRPWFWPRPGAFRLARSRGVAVLPGTDPLPLPGEERLVGSCGCLLQVHPGASGMIPAIVASLRDGPGGGCTYGRREKAGRFFLNQVRLRVSNGMHRDSENTMESNSGSVEREVPDIVTSSDDYARRFSGRAGEYFLQVQSDTVRTVMGGQGDGMRLIDVGGGHGQLAPMFFEQGYDVTVFGSANECHSRLLKIPAVGRRLDYVTGDVLDLPFPDQSFDAVVAVRLISHIDNWQRLIAEFCRVSRHSVVLDYPSLTSLNSLTPLLFSLKKTLEGNTRTYTSFFAKDLMREFAQHGFQMKSCQAQFFLPMVIHRALKGVGWLQAIERLCRVTGLTRLLGTPVIIRFERQE
ncbi:MAG: hypothetical protein BMS9Abin09_0316 [Gammaproteobacteria bacterium]|nr:MAG: hypothetical protein BMS9Abin09_0316 [Gammaproteobacteria bacterium]